MRAEDRRRQLLTVAAECFARKGYRATTTAGLAKAAGVTAPVLYHHFSGKDELFATLLGEARHAAVEGWRDAVATSGVAALLGPEAPKGATRFEQLVLGVITDLHNDARVTAAVVSGLRGLAAGLTAAIAQLQSTGTLAPQISPTQLAWLVLEWRLGHRLREPLEAALGDEQPLPDTGALLAQLLVSSQPVAGASAGLVWRPPG
jgi:AcrR family transcriptional regulator